jgi:hypothetical protein
VLKKWIQRHGEYKSLAFLQVLSAHPNLFPVLREMEGCMFPSVEEALQVLSSECLELEEDDATLISLQAMPRNRGILVRQLIFSETARNNMEDRLSAAIKSQWLDHDVNN